MPVSSPKPVEEDADLVERRDRRQALLLAELEVLLAAARGDVDDAGAFGLADVLPGDDAVDVLRRLTAGAQLLLADDLGDLVGIAARVLLGRQSSNGPS